MTIALYKSTHTIPYHTLLRPILVGFLYRSRPYPSRLVSAALQAHGLLRRRHLADQLEQFQLADEALFERVQNDDPHVLRLLIPPKTEYSYKLKRRRHDYELITKTSTLNTNDVVHPICMCTILFLFVYYSILFTSCPYFVYCVFVDPAFGCYTSINVCV